MVTLRTWGKPRSEAHNLSGFRSSSVVQPCMSDSPWGRGKGGLRTGLIGQDLHLLKAENSGRESRTRIYGSSAPRRRPSARAVETAAATLVVFNWVSEGRPQKEWIHMPELPAVLSRRNVPQECPEERFQEVPKAGNAPPLFLRTIFPS